MKLKIFIIALLVSLPFWWGANILEKDLQEIFYWQEIARNPQILTAQIYPVYNRANQQNLEISAKAAICVYSNGNKEKILFEKNSDKKLPIASLSKLMTALVALEHYDMEQIVKISKRAAEQPGIDAGKLKTGEKFHAKDVLWAMLIGSNNSAAYALAEMINEQGFVGLMNLEAKKIHLENTVFKNPTGLDHSQQYSTAKDLVKLTNELLDKHPVIWEILVKPEFELCSVDKAFSYKFFNTNELLGEIPLIVGGKTGETPNANGCFILVLKTQDNGYLINVILGSNDRFGEMKKLIHEQMSKFRKQF